jgi:hypothetical protein
LHWTVRQPINRTIVPCPRRCSAILAGTALLFSRAALGHGTPVALHDWGDFAATTARCQRALGAAADQCARAVFAAQRACIEPQLGGAACDQNATAAAVRAARMRAPRLLAPYCADADFLALHFLDSTEPLADVAGTCRQLETALVSAVYGPALYGPEPFGSHVLPVDAAAHACMSAAASTAEQVLRVGARHTRRTLALIAAVPMTAAIKDAQIARTHRQLDAAGAALVSRVASACPADQFAAIYRRPPQAFADEIGSRLLCLAGGVYVQSALVCPPPQCGNGMQETPEECDTASTDDAGWCRSGCTLSDCDVYPSTYALIQQAIFDGEGCSDDACHGATAGGWARLDPGALV